MILGIIFFVSSCVKEVIHTNKITFSTNDNYYSEQLTTKSDIFKLQTKTSYSGKDENNNDITKESKRERIDWVEGDVVFINMVHNNESISTSNYVVERYKVSDTDNVRCVSDSLTTENPLRSFETGRHIFYATYPSPLTNSDISEISKNGYFQFEMPNNLGYSIKREGDKYIICDNMNYAYMVASTETSDTPKNVHLEFKPYFNAYQFIIGEAPKNYHLTQIELSVEEGYLRTKNFVNGGVKSNGKQNSIYGVSDYNCVKTITYDLTTTNGYNNGIPLNKDNGVIDLTLLALPTQQSGIRVKFTFKKENGEIFLRETTTVLSDKEGNTVKIQPYQKLRIINVGSVITYEFGDLNDVILNHYGGYDNLSTNFKSVKKSGDNESFVGYRFQYSINDGFTWIDGFPNWIYKNFPINLPAIQPIDNPNSDNELAMDWRRKENFNLAKYNPSTNEITSVENSANCYVVNGYGTYYFPMVYGNSIKNGIYKNYYNYPFVNHNDNVINNAIIAEGQAKTAEVLWSDVPNLISNIQVNTPSTNYLFFEIKKENIKNGNAVIGLKVNGTIVWSWHIWVTDEDLSVTPYVYGYYFSRVNLGWIGEINNTQQKYISRSCLIRAIQDESNKISQAQIIQKGYFESNYLDGESLFYQWGRKDPMNQNLNYSTSTVSVGTSIKNPTTYYHPSSVNHWFNHNTSSYNNLWNNNGEKTIYDPSPVGFKVPGRINFQNNFVEVKPHKGIKTDNILYFPSSGHLDISGNKLILKGKGVGGIYSTNGSKSIGWNHILVSFQYFEIGKNFVIYYEDGTSDNSPIKQGNTIRPIKE